MKTKTLIRVENSPHVYRGKCLACGKLSYRWGRWKHVEDWHRKHKCLLKS